MGAGRRAAGTSIERPHGHTSGFGAFCRLCVRAAARSMPRAARPPAGDACHFSPRDSAPPRPLREIVSALSAICASDDKVISVSLLIADASYCTRLSRQYAEQCREAFSKSGIQYLRLKAHDIRSIPC